MQAVASGVLTRQSPPLPIVVSPSDEIKRLKTLYQLSMTLSGDPKEVFAHVARMIGELLDVKVVCLSEVRGDELYFLSVYVDGEMYSDAGKCDLAITPCATVESTRDLRIYDRVMERFPNASFLKDHNAFSYCGFPALDNHGKVVAVTCLLDDRPHDFSDSDQEILRIFGQRIGLEIERQWHLRAQEDAQRELVNYKNHLESMVTLRTRELEAAQDDLLRAERLATLGRLTATVSHELRNPLGTIRNSFFTLRRLIGENATSALPVLERIDRNIGRCDRIIAELLEFTREKNIHPEKIEVGRWLSDLLADMQLPDKVVIQTQVEPDLGAVSFDGQLMAQVLVNVINNARDALMKGIQAGGLSTGKIVIAAQRRSNSFEISVTDNGPGIPDADCAKVWEPLYSTKNFGIGLGLPLVKQIVELHGGTVQIQNVVGGGANISMTLPIDIGEK